jgi:hypothetical protein
MLFLSRCLDLPVSRSGRWFTGERAQPALGRINSHQERRPWQLRRVSERRARNMPAAKASASAPRRTSPVRCSEAQRHTGHPPAQAWCAADQVIRWLIPQREALVRIIGDGGVERSVSDGDARRCGNHPVPQLTRNGKLAGMSCRFGLANSRRR